MIYLKKYFITFFIFLGIDAVWLILVAKNFYASQIGFLLTPSPNLIAAVIFYMLFCAGLIYFVIDPALKNKKITQAIFSGALFGLITYATYDLTNMTTIANWPLLVTIVDLMWGTFLAGMVSGISFWVIEI